MSISHTARHPDLTSRFDAPCGLKVVRTEIEHAYERGVDHLLESLDEARGVLLASSFEYPGRYTRWDMGFADPPLVLTARGRRVELEALNDRGRIVLPAFADLLAQCPDLNVLDRAADRFVAEVATPSEPFPEELRSRQPTVFSAIRALVAGFDGLEDPHLGLYGAFGYELAFQFEAPRLALDRDSAARDLVLYLPDDLVVVDHRREVARRFHYDFETATGSTEGLPREGERTPYVPAHTVERECDHAPGEYAGIVREAIEAFRRGDLFEVVPGQTFTRPCPASPSEVFQRLKARNPAPYGALINLGASEYLVAASPEMFVRVDGRRIETCPISGTIERGQSAIEDASQVLSLLSSEKETSELTMCTDVDRNDKSRVCEPGSVRVIGRRQIEMYSRLIHTVDHVEGQLAAGFDALDGFLAHAWAVTVTGAPKQHAIQFIEDHEHSPRRWYGGALGMVGFDGNLNTGLTLRTVRIAAGVAEVRAGATLLFESDPDAEEAETRLKASAMLDAIADVKRKPRTGGTAPLGQPGKGRRILMVDHEDSFVHTLASYFRQTGASVTTFRSEALGDRLRQSRPDLVLLSPGPGQPADFRMSATIASAIELGVPVFGVCLGLQGIVEYFGGDLELLPPMHGKPSLVHANGTGIFTGLPGHFQAGRYHSLCANRATLPDALEVTAETDDGVIMAVAHRALPIAAVQFHPESLMSLHGEFGVTLVHNVVARLPAAGTSAARPPGGTDQRARFA